MLQGIVNELPEWVRSARFRITILYSTVLFLLAALLLGTLYLALLTSLHEEPVSSRYGTARVVKYDPFTHEIVEAEDFIAASSFERQVNKHTLENLRMFSFSSLAVLFLISLGVGWIISGRVLSPIDRITNVAKDIQATDLSRRIRLQGPEDELKRLADTFDGMLARLDEAFALQRRFIADASHELRNPLAIIRTNLDVDLADPNAGDERLRHTAVVVRRATERMSRLVDDLLALARLEAPNAVTERVDLSALAGEVLDELEVVAAERGVVVDRSLEQQVTVSGDTQALKRAVVNLVDNAIRFSPNGSPVTVATGRRDAWSYVAVADRGPGIKAEDQERVFERFWRGDKARSRALGGSGLGLAIVRQIVDGHRGAVRLFSAPGRGSTFVLWLPSFDPGSATDRREPAPEVSPLERAATT